MGVLGSNTILTTGFGFACAAAILFVAGRVYQWSKHTADREDAFRDGYNTATRALFSLAAQTNKVVTFHRPAPSTPTLVRGSAKVGLDTLDQNTPPTPLPVAHAPRHRASDETKIDLRPAPLLRKAGRRGR